MSESILNLDVLQQTPIKEYPFPYLVIPNFIKADYLQNLVNSFPEIKSRGSIPASSLACEPLFQRFIIELEGDALRQTISEKFSVDLEHKPTMLTLRGHVTERDGHIHTDSKSKLITLLLYMNTTWDSQEGKLRLLNNNSSLDDYAEEVNPVAGSCLIFKVTDNCWHGHSTFIGKRLSMQLNYMVGRSELSKHLNHHRLTAKLKQWFSRFFRSE